MKLKACAIGISLSLVSSHAWAAPEFGAREGDLACLGLLGMGLAGASASQPAEPSVVAALSMAFGFYLGRASKLEPKAGKLEVDGAINKLTLEEKNAYANLCLRKASELMAPIAG